MSGGRVALVTGVGRVAGIGAAIVERLAADGWDIAVNWWSPYDERMPWGRRPEELDEILSRARTLGVRTLAFEADLADPAAPAALFERVTADLGAPAALVLSHAESVDSAILDTTLESFDRHFAVNTRAAWLLIREFGLRFSGTPGEGRIVALTSDHTAFNLPYGASKGALDRIVLAAAVEFAELGITSNAVNPGPTDTGWLTPELSEWLIARTPGGRLGQPSDAASFIAFLLSEQGRWINGQLLFSDGGFSTKA